MPLVNKQPFKPDPIPDNLGPDDEVFYHELTNEIFTSHDAYFDRFLYCNSLVWTCSRTGKSGLTFKEALDSECAGKDGDSEETKKKRKRSKNVDGKKPISSPAEPKKRARPDEGAVKVDSDNPESTGDAQATLDGQPVKKKKKKYPYDPKKYSMPVPEGFDPSLLTPTGKIDGRKLKSKQNQMLAEQLLQASGYEPKKPSPSKGGKGKSKQEEAKRKEEEAKRKEEEAKRKQAELAKERELEAKRKKEAAALARQQERQKKEEERKRAVAFIQAWEKKCEDLERDDLRRLPQPTPVNCEIPERLFGDSIFIMEAIFNFHDLYTFSEIYPEGLKFDTLEEILIDKQEGGALGTLLTNLLRVIFNTQPTADGYGLDDDSTMLLAKTADTNSVNNTKDSNNIKTEADGEGDLEQNGNAENCEHDEDDNDENNEKYVNMNDRIGKAIKAAQEVKKTFSKPLPEMEITPSNVTEILRLHLLQSGSFPKGRTIYNGWYSSREDPGLWLCMEEPDLMKKLGEVTVYDLDMEERIKILHTLIYQLLTFIKSRNFMELASEQLLELRKQYRKEAADFARWDRENCVKRMQPPKRRTDQISGAGGANGTAGPEDPQNHNDGLELDPNEARHLGSNQPSECGDDGDEETSNQNQRLKSCLKTNGLTEDSSEVGTKQRKITFKNGQLNGVGDTHLEGELTNGDTDKLVEDEADDQSFEALERAYQQNKVDYEDFQRERAVRAEQLNEILLSLRTELRNNQAVYAIHPIGRDRAYKRYWLFQSLPGLFIEQDDEYVGECLPQPTPLESRYKKLFGKENPLIHPNEADLIRPKTCDVACSTDSNDGNGHTASAASTNEHQQQEEEDKKLVVKTEPRGDATTEPKKELSGADNNNITEVKDEDQVTHHLNGDEDVKEDPDEASEHDGEPAHEEGIIVDEMNYCTGDKATCYIHGPKRPTHKWWFYHTPESIDQLIECLNKRGYRESELHDALAAESANIKPRVAECESYKLNKLILEQSGIRRSRRLRTKTGKRRSRKAEYE